MLWPAYNHLPFTSFLLYYFLLLITYVFGGGRNYFSIIHQFWYVHRFHWITSLNLRPPYCNQWHLIIVISQIDVIVQLALLAHMWTWLPVVWLNCCKPSMFPSTNHLRIMWKRNMSPACLKTPVDTFWWDQLIEEEAGARREIPDTPMEHPDRTAHR